jgi:predicted acyltransferase
VLALVVMGSLGERGAAPAPGRLVAVDVYRGLAVAGMVLVDNPGFDDRAYGPVRHAEWNGWTPADLVFPSFLFLVGVSVVFAFSARLQRGQPPRAVIGHALKRTVILILIGLLVNGFPVFRLADWRVDGVLQRIALCYLCTALLVLYAGWRAQVATAAACLLGYWALLRVVPVPGYGLPGRDVPFMDPDRNIVAWLDRALFMGHLYEGTRDPEAILSTIPAIATCLLGVLTGRFLQTERDPRAQASRMAVAGTVFLVVGTSWGLVFPINKHLWTSSFTVLSAGFALVTLAAFTWVLEARRWRGAWTMPLLVLGMNPIVGFVADALVYGPGYAVELSGTDREKVPLHEVMSDRLVNLGVGDALASLVYSALAVAFVWALLFLLWRRRMFLKI